MKLHTAQAQFTTARDGAVGCDPHMVDHPPADLLAWVYETKKITHPTQYAVAPYPNAPDPTAFAIAGGCNDQEAHMIGLLLHLLDTNQLPDTEWRYMRLRKLQRAAQVHLELARRNPDLSQSHLMGLIRDVRQLDAEVKRMEPLRSLDRGYPRNAAKHSPCRWSSNNVGGPCP